MECESSAGTIRSLTSANSVLALGVASTSLAGDDQTTTNGGTQQRKPREGASGRGVRTGVGKHVLTGRDGAVVVLGRRDDRLVPGSLVDDLHRSDDRRDGCLVGDGSLVDERPLLGVGLVLVLRPVGVAERARRLPVRDVVLSVGLHPFAVDDRPDDRVTVEVDHLLPDGRNLLIHLDPGSLAQGVGLPQNAVGVLGEVDRLVGNGLLVGDRLLVVLGPDRQVHTLVRREDAGVRLVRRRAQVALVVAVQVERLIRSVLLRDHLLRVTVLVPVVEGRLGEPGGIGDVGRRRPVGRTVLLEGSDVLLVFDRLGLTVLVPPVEGRVTEPAGIGDVRRTSAIGLAVLRVWSHVGLVDHDAVVGLGVARGKRVTGPVATVIQRHGVGVLNGPRLSVGAVSGRRSRRVHPDRVRRVQGEGRATGVVHRLDADVHERVTRGRRVVCIDAGDLVAHGGAGAAVVAEVHRTRLGDVERVDTRLGHDRIRQLPPVTTEVGGADAAEPVEHGVPILARGDLDLLVLDGVDLDGLLVAALGVRVLRHLLVLVLIVLDELLSLVGAGELVLQVGLLLDAGVLARELVLEVGLLLLAGHELEVLPLVVGDCGVTRDDLEVLRLLVGELFDGRDVLLPARLLMGDGVGAGRGSGAEMRQLTVVDHGALRRCHQALTERVDGLVARPRCGHCRCGGADRCQGGDGADGHETAHARQGAVHVRPSCRFDGYKWCRWCFELLM